MKGRSVWAEVNREEVWMCVLEGKDRMYFGGGEVVSPDYEIILGKPHTMGFLVITNIVEFLCCGNLCSNNFCFCPYSLLSQS